MDNTAPVISPVTMVTTGEPTPAIRRGWARAILSYPAWMGALLATSIPGFLLVRLAVGPEADLESATSGPLGTAVMALQLAGTVLVVYLFCRFIDRRSMVSLGLPMSWRFLGDLVAGTMWGIALISSVFLCNYLAGSVTIAGIEFPWLTLATQVVIMFLVGINEELYVRGYLLTNFMESTNKYVALLLTSLIFAASHLFNPNWTLIGLINIILAGLLLGIYFVHRRNLWFPIGMHFSWNLFQGTVFGSQVSGVPTPSILQAEYRGNDLLTGGEFGFEASLAATAAIGVSIILVHLIYRPRAAGASQPSPMA